MSMAVIGPEASLAMPEKGWCPKLELGLESQDSIISTFIKVWG